MTTDNAMSDTPTREEIARLHGMLDAHERDNPGGRMVAWQIRHDTLRALLAAAEALQDYGRCNEGCSGPFGYPCKCGWVETRDCILGTPTPDAHATDATCQVCHRTPCGHWDAFRREHLATDAQFVNMDEIGEEAGP